MSEKSDKKGSRVADAREILGLYEKQLEVLMSLSAGNEVLASDVERWFGSVVAVLLSLQEANGGGDMQYLKWARKMIDSNIEHNLAKKGGGGEWN